MVYYIILSILTFVLCGVLTDDARQCKQCADIIHTTPMHSTNSTDELPPCSTAQPTPCNGTAFGCAEFDGNVSFGNQRGTTNMTVKFQYCSASGQTICYNVTITNVGNDTSGLLNAFLAAGLDPAKQGYGLEHLLGIDGQICMQGSSPVVSGQNKLFPSVVILVLALICQ